METLLAMISFRDAPLDDGTSMASGEAPRHGTSAANGGGGSSGVVARRLDAATNKWPMERLAASMASGEAPLDGTLDGSTAPSSVAAGGSNVDAATNNKWPVERLAASMAFCEAPFDGTLDGTTSAPSSSSSSSSGSASGDAMERRILAMVFRDEPVDGNRTLPPSSGATAGGYDIASAISAGVSDVMASMPSCEAPPPSVAAGNYCCSTPGVSGMVASALAGVAAATRKLPMERLVASMAFCEAPLDGTFVDPSSSGGARGNSASATNVPEAGGGREKAGTVVDGLAIFETVVLQ